jgi:hypothetical protein
VAEFCKHGNEQFSLLVFNAVWSVEIQPALRRIIPPSSRSKKKRSKKPAKLATCFMLVSSLAYSSALKMEATCSSETSVDFQRTMRSYIPEGRTLHNDCSKNP